MQQINKNNPFNKALISQSFSHLYTQTHIYLLYTYIYVYIPMSMQIKIHQIYNRQIYNKMATSQVSIRGDSEKKKTNNNK